MLSAVGCSPVRAAQVSERDAIREFQVKNHLEASVYSEGSRIAQINELPDDFPQLYSDEAFLKGHIFVVTSEADGGYVATLGLAGFDEKESNKLEIVFLSVREDFRKRGLGQTLLDQAIQVAKGIDGCKGLRLLTLKDVLAPACRLYERNGFKITNERQTEFYVLLYYELQWE
eukprot:TRINITY_DN1325_c0_g1_i1.p1 TRINITY_DN1325_c0_g1~~TRINITY_DN1325_c0_g1_i1.p1  ORF type:complete len:183 (-),score=23.48 TRINITY_DN1325_c0_g1_i1:150-668(-)